MPRLIIEITHLSSMPTKSLVMVYFVYLQGDFWLLKLFFEFWNFLLRNIGCFFVPSIGLRGNYKKKFLDCQYFSFTLSYLFFADFGVESVN